MRQKRFAGVDARMSVGCLGEVWMICMAGFMVGIVHSPDKLELSARP